VLVATHAAEQHRVQRARHERRDVAQVHLVGDLVELRPLREDDFDALYAVAADPLLWEQHPDRRRHREEVFREFFAQQLASGGGILVVDRGTGEAIGSSRFHGYDPERSEVEIGWTFLARSRWGGAYNRELKALMLGHAFRFVDTVVFLVHPDNVRSQRSLEKLGAVRFGERIDGNGRRAYAYAIERRSTVQGSIDAIRS
jgi:RimJ/RimL family protein N-acetyltransferase